MSKNNTSETPNDSIGEQISSLLKDPEALKAAASNAADGAADYIRKHPYQTLGAALAVGFFAGMYIGKKKQS